jgi:DNA repair protein RadA/Sms
LLEPGTDLGVALAVVSALTDVPVARDVVMIGEVGLAGEVRQVAQSSRRLAEAARLGYRRAIAPHGSPQVAGIELVPVHSLADAVVRAMGPARGHQG